MITWGRSMNCTVLENPSKMSKSQKKISFDIPRKLSIFWGWKTRENVVVLGFLAVDNSDFTRKNCQKIFGWKTRENVGVLYQRIFWFRFGWIYGKSEPSLRLLHMGLWRRDLSSAFVLGEYVGVAARQKRRNFRHRRFRHSRHSRWLLLPPRLSS